MITDLDLLKIEMKFVQVEDIFGCHFCSIAPTLSSLPYSKPAIDSSTVILSLIIQFPKTARHMYVPTAPSANSLTCGTQRIAIPNDFQNSEQGHDGVIFPTNGRRNKEFAASQREE